MNHITAARAATPVYTRSATEDIRIQTRSNFIQQHYNGNLENLRSSKATALDNLKEILEPSSRYQFSPAEISELAKSFDNIQRTVNSGKSGVVSMPKSILAKFTPEERETFILDLQRICIHQPAHLGDPDVKINYGGITNFTNTAKQFKSSLEQAANVAALSLFNSSAANAAASSLFNSSAANAASSSLFNSSAPHVVADGSEETDHYTRFEFDNLTLERKNYICEIFSEFLKSTNVRGVLGQSSSYHDLIKAFIDSPKGKSLTAQGIASNAREIRGVIEMSSGMAAHELITSKYDHKQKGLPPDGITRF